MNRDGVFLFPDPPSLSIFSLCALCALLFRTSCIASAASQVTWTLFSHARGCKDGGKPEKFFVPYTLSHTRRPKFLSGKLQADFGSLWSPTFHSQNKENQSLTPSHHFSLTTPNPVPAQTTHFPSNPKYPPLAHCMFLEDFAPLLPHAQEKIPRHPKILLPQLLLRPQPDQEIPRHLKAQPTTRHTGRDLQQIRRDALV